MPDNPTNNPVIPPDATKEDLVKILNTLFADSNSRANYIKSMTGEKPVHWKKNSTATYYKEKYGKQLKNIVDAMMQDHEDREYRFDEFPHLSPSSVYLMVNQSKMYLLEKMDYLGDYRRFFESISIKREHGVGVKLKFIRQDENDIMPARVIAYKSVIQLSDDIDKFLNDENQKEFKLTGLTLSPEERTQLEQSLVSLDGIIYNITETTIKIIKANV